MHGRPFDRRDQVSGLPAFKRSWRVRLLLLKLIFRKFVARLTGREWVAGGAALQGRMLQAAIIQQSLERGHADFSLADVLMPVEFRSTLRFRVIAMPYMNIFQPNGL